MDCALFNNNTITGLDMCFKDSSRALLLGFLKYSYFNSTPLEAEVLDLFTAINVAINCHIPYVIFESDCKLFVDTINSNSTPNNEFGDIISRCKNLLSRNNFIVSYVRRQTNRIVYNIARVTLFHPNPIFFMKYHLHLYLLFFNKMNQLCLAKRLHLL